MPLYYYIFLISLSLVFAVTIYFFVRRKKDLPLELFFEALKRENDGQFEAAVITYETALNEVKNRPFRNANLKNKIIEKLKILRAFIEYKTHVQR
jgi:hypothetical protein